MQAPRVPFTASQEKQTPNKLLVRFAPLSLRKIKERLAKSLTSFIQGNKVPAHGLTSVLVLFLFALGLLWSSSLQHIRTFTES